MSRKATVRARGLGTELRELRKHVGLPMTKVGEKMGWSVATVSRIETGQRGVTSEEVAAMMVIYKAAPEERDRLIELARDAHRPGWWETGDPGLPKQLTALIGFEAQATKITDVALLLLPGLLQTADYARAIMSAAGLPASAVETRVATRLGRQEVLRSDAAPKFVAFIDEAVLHRPLGGYQVMREQLNHLVKATRQSNVHLRVLPFTESGHRALNGAFTMLQFVKAQTIVLLEHKRSSLFLDNPNDIDAFAMDLTMLDQTALDGSDSVEFITEFATRYEGRLRSS